jgi:hypothetical protein
MGEKVHRDASAQVAKMRQLVAPQVCVEIDAMYEQGGWTLSSHPVRDVTKGCPSAAPIGPTVRL